ncbi:hypothetical protein [Streptomyces sp. WM6378]|uniref:hypothetical protein n=1 Tax=Streptomyces sp. WM6378 TaxID=1415557 RepID=UPI00131BBB91|nr:hypothetical protein [Streptomyces sp. WM6378]
MTTADEKIDPFHVPLPDEVPVQEHTQPRPGAPASGDGKATAKRPIAPPAAGAVDAPVDAVDAQVSAPEGVPPTPRGSGVNRTAAQGSSASSTAPAGKPDWWRIARNAPKPAASPKAAPRDAKPAWWDPLYRDQDADLDTNSGHILTVPADGGPVLIQVQKSNEPDAPGPHGEEADEAVARPRLFTVEKPRPTLQSRPQYATRWRPSRFWRVITFNGTAAAAGSVLGLNAYLSQFPPAAMTAAGGLLGAGMALAGAFAAWKAAGSELLAPFVPFGVWGRLGVVFIAAEVGRRLGQTLLPYTSDTMARSVGLNQTDVSLLVVGLTMCGASGWLVWRTRHGGLLKRWLSRIPLATSLLVCALYYNGPVI